MTKKWLALVAVVCVAALALPFLASARHQVVRDGNDTKGLLDIRRVKVEFANRPRWTVATWRGWSPPRVWDRGFFLIQLDTFGGNRFDYYAFVRSDGRKMIGTLVRDRPNRPDRTLSSIRAVKPSRNRLRVRFPLKKMRIGDKRVFYRWNVQTIFSSSRCPRSCFDFAPDRGAIREPIPGRVPPTPTPTITETPTPDPTETPTPDPTETPTPTETP